MTLMYHFAFLVLSIALFGLGSGAIVHFVTDFFEGVRNPILVGSPCWLRLHCHSVLAWC